MGCTSLSLVTLAFQGARRHASERVRANLVRLRHILVLRLSQHAVEQILGVSHGVVCRTLKKVRTRDLTWLAIELRSDEELKQLLYGQSKSQAMLAPLPDWPTVDTQLRLPVVTLMLLHQEYLQ